MESHGAVGDNASSSRSRRRAPLPGYAFPFAPALLPRRPGARPLSAYDDLCEPRIAQRNVDRRVRIINEISTRPQPGSGDSPAETLLARAVSHYRGPIGPRI